MTVPKLAALVLFIPSIGYRILHPHLSSLALVFLVVSRTRVWQGLNVVLFHISLTAKIVECLIHLSICSWIDWFGGCLLFQVCVLDINLLSDVAKYFLPFGVFSSPDCFFWYSEALEFHAIIFVSFLLLYSLCLYLELFYLYFH